MVFDFGQQIFDLLHRFVWQNQIFEPTLRCFNIK